MIEFSFDQVDRSKPWALFFDIDGTLIEFAETPEAVVMPATVTSMLQRLAHETKGGMAIITGRPIPSADRLFSPVEFPMAGLHGGEFRINGRHEAIPVPAIPAEWRIRAKSMSETCSGVSYEEKRQGFALHYREAPHHRDAVNEALADMVNEAINPGYHLLHANGATEIRPNGIDKGSAIEKFMETSAFAGRHPIFFGDDTTDDDGFRALKKMGGTTVLVGHRSPAEADFYVKDPQTMRGLLSALSMPN